VLEAQSNVLCHLSPIEGGIAEPDDALDRVLDRARIDLAAWHIVPAIIVEESTPLDAELEIGVRSANMDLMLPIQVIDQALLTPSSLLSGGHRILTVD